MTNRVPLACLGLAVLAAGRVAGQTICPSVVVRQVDISRYPRVRASILLSDAEDKPITSTQPVRVQLLENGKVVESRAISQQAVYSVLALDVSGSMRGPGDPLGEAKRAAIRYMREAPPHYHIAVVAFGNEATVVGGFEMSRLELERRLGKLQAAGYTALQDGLGLALELLRDKDGRRGILLLTDGKEESGPVRGGSRTYAGVEGRAKVLATAVKQHVTVDAIGLGGRVDAATLQELSWQTRGQFKTAQQAGQLSELFSASGLQLSREQTFEYVSRAALTGAPLEVNANVIIGGVVCTTSGPQRLVLPGPIPNVKGSFGKYFAGIGGLLALPWALAFAGAVRKTRRFRSRHYEVVAPGSIALGKRDPNTPPKDPPIGIGDHVVVSPRCQCPHYVRSWRFAKCHCMRHPSNGSEFCYVRQLSPWMRALLDKLSGGYVGANGRLFRCSCAGDMGGN